jgi:hypothetical protein
MWTHEQRNGTPFAFTEPRPLLDKLAVPGAVRLREAFPMMGLIGCVLSFARLDFCSHRKLRRTCSRIGLLCWTLLALDNGEYPCRYVPLRRFVYQLRDGMKREQYGSPGVDTLQSEDRLLSSRIIAQESPNSGDNSW